MAVAHVPDPRRALGRRGVVNIECSAWAVMRRGILLRDRVTERQYRVPPNAQYTCDPDGIHEVSGGCWERGAMNQFPCLIRSSTPGGRPVTYSVIRWSIRTWRSWRAVPSEHAAGGYL